MNTRFLLVATISAAGFSLPAIGGRDAGQMMQQEQASKAAVQPHAQEVAGCDKVAAKLALPLDHGPRAETTPWLNQQRRLREIEKCQQRTSAAPK
jgi:hypothetical protein